MNVFRLNGPSVPGSTRPDVEVLLDEGRVKIRRIDLAAGVGIPPCKMQEDVVFIVLSGRVVFASESSTETVDAPGAVYIPGGDATRSMKADQPARVLAILCRTPGVEGSAV